MKRLLVVIPPERLPDGFIEAVISRAGPVGAEVRALYVIDALWFRYSGSDWLSTGPSRAEFDLYMRETLRRAGEGLIGELALAAREAGLAFSSEIQEGPQVMTILRAAFTCNADLIAAAPNHPDIKALIKKSRCTVHVYPRK
jgi:nucleotide-binding universal stress UspA family protein